MKFIYNVLIQALDSENRATSEIVRDKWLSDVGVFEENYLAKLFRSTVASNIRVFGFKLISQILTTHVSLQTIGVKECNLCTLCNGNVETLLKSDKTVLESCKNSELYTRWNFSC